MRFSSRLQDAHSHLKHFSFADESSGNPDATHSGSQIELETALEERDKETKQLERPYAAPLEADVVMFNFQKILNQSANPSENFCVPWDVNTDDWWTHHPKWRVTHENDTHTCFSIFHDSTARHACAPYVCLFVNKTHHFWRWRDLSIVCHVPQAQRGVTKSTYLLWGFIFLFLFDRQ